MGSAEIQGDLWGARAVEWADLQESSFRPLYEAAFAALKLDKGASLLDAGCGAGLACSIAQSQGAQVSGIDAATALVDIAKQRCPGADIRVGELEALPFADDSFDAVLFVSYHGSVGAPAGLSHTYSPRAVTEARLDGRVTGEAGINALVAAIAPRGRGVTYQAAISVTQDIGMAAGPASGLALSASIGARLMWLLALPLGTLAGAATARAATLRPAPDDPADQDDAPPLVDTEA